ncbi:hypothetical protein CWATWH8502_3335 [Crocosphaera watsonii WH 8502]|uniref:Uncharacterized protein n=2 Tax=Crocosphaera watsonii TaxID=263511 RepID=T2J3Q6_CROWT|nr:hypothetical protein CWATWH8502_3335 [Crocosphaera watsonii WH 8502]CCQ59781.1 hypothetical protein CWATWH0401_655 [Crocosphaera watsonii WH 0401]
MDNELFSFLLGVTLLIAYLIFSAKTEMGTKLFKKKRSNRSSEFGVFYRI